MIIIGINAYHADASAAIFVDGKLIAAIEEERFTRIKHWAGFPVRSIEFCLKEVGVSIKDVDYFAIGRDPSAKILQKAYYLARHPLKNVKDFKKRLANNRQNDSIEKELSSLSGKPEKYFVDKIKNIEHHKSHIASAFFASPFESAACISIDGSGDFTTTMIGKGEENEIRIIASINFPHSLGFFYTAFTQLLGFTNYGDEYKVMGLAPYGEPRYVDQMHDVVKLRPGGMFSLNLVYFRKGFGGVVSYPGNIPMVVPLYGDMMIKKFGEPRKTDEPLSQYHKDLAASVQKMTELILFHILNTLFNETKDINICIAGGVAQNSVAMGKITTHTGFKNIYIPPAGHDAGIALGAALFVQHQIFKEPRQHMVSPYTGGSFSNEEICIFLDTKGIAYTQLSEFEINDTITDCIINGGVVGWFNGKAEFGPRALGGRSILADPRNKNARYIINNKIKRRESFRPFAPSVLKEFAKEYFDTDMDVPFMEKVYPVKKEKRSVIPAVTHVDGTARLHTVDKNISPEYYALIEAFRVKTGVPLLLNTSFNENEPIVNTPEEALACFLRTDMDMLAMQNILIKK
ncbi:MAG: carbamoyltransferase C-terminal domain-containing protein [Ferruginibacter sp.]